MLAVTGKELKASIAPQPGVAGVFRPDLRDAPLRPGRPKPPCRGRRL